MPRLANACAVGPHAAISQTPAPLVLTPRLANACAVGPHAATRKRLCRWSSRRDLANACAVSPHAAISQTNAASTFIFPNDRFQLFRRRFGPEVRRGEDGVLQRRTAFAIALARLP